MNGSIVDIVVQATQPPGLQHLQASKTRNLEVSIQPFTKGTTQPITVFANKIDPNQSASLVLSVCSDSCRICDPVITLETRLRGRPETRTFTDLPAEENRIVIQNGNPGLDNVLITVNGAAFRAPHLNDGEEQTIDISSAMLPGNANVISFTVLGKPGGSATVIIRD